MCAHTMYVCSYVHCVFFLYIICICTAPVCHVVWCSTTDILFLRWKGEVKRAPIPSPLTMTTLKSLFAAMFEVDMAIKKDPHWVVFMQDSRSEEWIPVTSPR